MFSQNRDSAAFLLLLKKAALTTPDPYSKVSNNPKTRDPELAA